MKRSIRTLFIIFILTICFAALAWAGSATKDEVIAKCEAAAKLIQEKGIDAASQTIGDKSGPFVWKDSYVFLMDLDGKMIAHPIKPELTKDDNLLQVADTDGKPLFVEFVKLAGQQGQGWVDYMWPKPGQDQPVAKSSYIYRVPNTPYFVGAGIYK
jgi:signal transduction histidine kinase